MNKELIKVLIKVQKEMPVVGKTTEAFQYKYAPIDHVWDKVGGVLHDNGFAVINEITPEGLKTIAVHEHGELTSFIAFSGLDLKPQTRGSEITYARRYNLTAMFNIIVAGEDDDATEAMNAPFKAPVRPVVKSSTSKDTKMDDLNLEGLINQVDEKETRRDSQGRALCEGCGASTSAKVEEFSRSVFNKVLCMNCQGKQ